jgi:hypothetical protein
MGLECAISASTPIHLECAFLCERVNPLVPLRCARRCTWPGLDLNGFTLMAFCGQKGYWATCYLHRLCRLELFCRMRTRFGLPLIGMLWRPALTGP